MPPLETSIAVETEEIARIKYHIAPELKDLCLMIKEKWVKDMNRQFTEEV